MRIQRRPWVMGFYVFALTALSALGCAKIPPCTVSPVEIEETRESVKLVEKDLVDAKAKAKELSERLAAKQAEFDSKKDKPAELRKKLEELKKGSGRATDEKKKKKGKESA